VSKAVDDLIKRHDKALLGDGYWKDGWLKRFLFWATVVLWAAAFINAFVYIIRLIVPGGP
jgi:hypothetical protein